MVYESDFYTIRRPYGRPTITSYSVTGYRPSVWQTTQISPIGAHSRLRLSVLLNELNRIQNRPRMHLGYVPTEDFLNSRPLVEFDDETKYIRAEADKLMRYIYVPVPHKTTKVPLTTTYDRLSRNGLIPYKRSGISNDIVNMSYYYEPTRTTIGRGHLACVTFAGGRGYPRRKHLFSDEYRDIGDEIKFRSYYNKNLNPQIRLDDTLSLATGFAARLLTTERRPFAATENEKIKSSKFRKNEPKTPGELLFTQKREKLLEEDTNRYNVPIVNDKIVIESKIEKVEKIDEKPKVKKESRRKSSTKNVDQIVDKSIKTPLKSEEIPQNFVEKKVPSEDIPQNSIESEEIPQSCVEQISEDVPQKSIESEENPQKINESEDTLQDNTEQISEDIPQKIIESEEIPQKNIESEEIPQNIFESEEIPQENIEQISEEIPQKIIESEEIPQKIIESEEIPQENIEQISEDIPQNIIESEEIPQKINESEEIPQNIHESEDIPQNNEEIKAKDDTNEIEQDTENETILSEKLDNMADTEINQEINLEENLEFDNKILTQHKETKITTTTTTISSSEIKSSDNDNDNDNTDKQFIRKETIIKTEIIDDKPIITEEKTMTSQIGECNDIEENSQPIIEEPLTPEIVDF